MLASQHEPAHASPASQTAWESTHSLDVEEREVQVEEGEVQVKGVEELMELVEVLVVVPGEVGRRGGVVEVQGGEGRRVEVQGGAGMVGVEEEVEGEEVRLVESR